MSDSIREGMERFKEALERVRSGASTAEEVDLSSGRVRISPDQEEDGGVRIEALEENREAGAGSTISPEMRGILNGLKDMVGKVRSGEMGSAEVRLPSGGTMRLARDEEIPGAFKVEAGEGGPTIRSIPFEPAQEPPEHYPEGAPFLVGVPSAYIDMGEGSGWTLRWFSLSDPEDNLEELRRQLQAGGWVETGASRASTGSGWTRWTGFEREGVRRVLTLTRMGKHSQVTLMEMPPESGENS